jgi:hypothetical protein
MVSAPIEALGTPVTSMADVVDAALRLTLLAMFKFNAARLRISMPNSPLLPESLKVSTVRLAPDCVLKTA